jgi:c-di-GMP-binding flagellar brake protein YcgR
VSRLEGADAAWRRLVIAWPTDRERRLLPAKVGDTIELAGSMQDALYSVKVRILRCDQASVPLLAVEIVGDWQRSQRREAVRIPVAIRPRIANRILGDVAEPLRAGITNISAAGLQLRSQDQLKVGDELELVFALPDSSRELDVQARVRRVQPQEKLWVAGCQLERVPDKTVQHIVQFIFAQQRAELARLRKAS